MVQVISELIRQALVDGARRRMTVVNVAERDWCGTAGLGVQ